MAAVDEDDLRLRGVDATEVAGEPRACQLRDLTGHLDARRTAPDDDEGEPGAARVGVLLVLGHLEGPEDAAADLQGVVDRLHAGCVAGELVMTEVRLGGSGRDDQAVVLVGPDRVVGPPGRHGPSSQVEPGDRGHLHRHVVVAAQDVPNRWGDLPSREDAGRELVEQRLEEVVVPCVDERHVDGCPPEELRGEQPAEPASDDDHPVVVHGSLRSAQALDEMVADS